jgi:hypothetical protein
MSVIPAEIARAVVRFSKQTFKPLLTTANCYTGPLLPFDEATQYDFERLGESTTSSTKKLIKKNFEFLFRLLNQAGAKVLVAKSASHRESLSGSRFL